MACNCNSIHTNLPCCCPTEVVETCPTTTACPDAQPCNVIVQANCVIYNGPSYECAGITTGMTVAEVIEIIIDALGIRCTSYAFNTITGETTLFTFLECGQTTPTTITVNSELAIEYCINTIYPIVVNGPGSYTDNGSCCNG